VIGSDWKSDRHPVDRIQQLESRVAELESALNSMLTFFAIDEDEWSKSTFDKARKALTKKEKP